MKSKLLATFIVIPVVMLFFLGGYLYLQIRNGQSAFSFEPNSRQADKAKGQALPIIVAIDQYYLKHGKYPPSIQALVPNELNDTPAPPIYGYPSWIYFQGGADEECSIGFGAKGGYPACHYSLKLKEWYVDN